MNPQDVNPKKWTETTILYNNEGCSIVWGQYEGAGKLGIRWNGDEDVGFPRQGGNPTWFVLPQFLWDSILLKLFKDSRNQERAIQIADIMQLYPG